MEFFKYKQKKADSFHAIRQFFLDFLFFYL